MVKAGKILESVRRCVAEVAVKLNHTSSFQALALPQEGSGITADKVALWVVPEVIAVQVNVGFTVRTTAPGQLSLIGGGGRVPTQILKLALVVARVEVV